MPDDRPWLPGEDDRAFLGWRDFLLSDASLEIRRHALRLRQAASAEQWAPDLAPANAELAESRAVVAKVLVSRLAKREPSIPLGWMGDEPPLGPDAFSYRARAAQLISIGAGLFGFGDRVETEVRTVLGTAFGFDALHMSAGDLLGGYPFFPDPPEPPAGGFSGIKDLPPGHCVLGIGEALGKFGAVFSQRPREWPTATISEVSPRRACPGDTISIRGSGFGATQPRNVEVMITAEGGGCVSAQVVSWSDSEIQVTVPPDAGHGCVGLIEHPGDIGLLAEATSELAGEIESCLGLAGFVAARNIRHLGESAVGACPSCGDPATSFVAGPPTIDFFVADGATVGDVAPGGTVDLSWSVIGADTVAITPQPAGSLPAVPGPLAPDRGSARAGPLPLQDGDRGAYLLTADNACGTVTKTLEIVCRGKRALVLSGGGMLGAFEVGAARCLYDAAGLRPDIICGTSVGALNAAKLAEGPAGLSPLESLWNGMNTKSDFYLEPGWFTTLDPLVRSFLSGGSSNIGGQIAVYVFNFVSGKLWGALAELFVPGYMYTIATSLYPAITTIIDLGRLIVAVTEALKANALFINTPLDNLITANLDAAKIAASGIDLRMTMVSLDTGRTEVVTESGSLVSTGHRLPLDRVLLASCSIPGAFSPVPISGTSRGTEHFVDGGARDNTPVREAVQAGADRVDVISVTPRRLPSSQTGFGQAKLLDIAPRALEILMDEVRLGDVEPFRGFGVPVTVAAPTFVPYDTLTVDPGLISINMDYGYMRAYDDLVGPAADRTQSRLSTDDIILLRLEAWNEEYHANGERLGPRPKGSPLVPVPDPMALQNVRDLKLDIRTKTKDRVARFGPTSVPQKTAPWWQAFERHPWQPLIPDPWASFNSRLGSLPAVPVPPP